MDRQERSRQNSQAAGAGDELKVFFIYDRICMALRTVNVRDALYSSFLLRVISLLHIELFAGYCSSFYDFL